MQVIGRPHLSSTRKVQRSVGHYAVEPWAERLIQVEPVQRLIGSNESILNRVFRILMHCDDRSCHGVSTLLVQSDQCAEGGLVATLGCGRQSTLIRKVTRGVTHALRPVARGKFTPGRV